MQLEATAEGLLFFFNWHQSEISSDVVQLSPHSAVIQISRANDFACGAFSHVPPPSPDATQHRQKPLPFQHDLILLHRLFIILPSSTDSKDANAARCWASVLLGRSIRRCLHLLQIYARNWKPYPHNYASACSVRSREDREHIFLSSRFNLKNSSYLLLPKTCEMSVPNDENSSQHYQLQSHFFEDLLDSIIVDVASECHRIARLSLDRNLEDEEEELRLSAQARARVADPGNSAETNKHVVDIFGQTHPPVASEIFECMNCGRSIVAGRFAPHLEKCMGKGRKARMKSTRSGTGAQSRQTRSSQAFAYSPYSGSTTNINRVANGTSGPAADECSGDGFCDP